MLCGFPLLLAVFGAALAIGTFMRLRRFRERNVLEMLSLLVSRNLPLLSGLRAAADVERGRLRRIFQSLASRLDAGDSISMAIRLTMPSFSSDVLGQIESAERLGTLPSVMRTLTATRRRDDQVQRMRPASGLAPYFVIVLLVALVVIPAYFVFILPKMNDIAQDFGCRLPSGARWLSLAGTVAHDYLLLFAIAIAALLIAVSQALIMRHWVRRDPARAGWGEELLDAACWSIPGLRQWAEARALARQTPLLASAVRAGRDLSVAAEHAAWTPVNLFARRRLRRWSDAIQAGNEPLAAAVALRFPAPMIAALRAARAGSDMPAALEYLGRYYESIHVHWERVARAFLTPCIVVLFGVAICFFVFSIFQMQVAIMDSIIGEVY